MSDLTTVQFKKQDKVVQLILIGVGLTILAGLGYGFALILPFLVAAAKNTIIFFAEIAVLVGMVVGALSIWNERELLYYKWKNFVRKVRRAVVREDPVGILDTAIKRFAGRLEQIEERISEAIGAKKTQESKQKMAIQKSQEAQSQMKAAQNNNDDASMKRHAVAAVRWEQAAKEMQPTVELMAKMQTSMQRARDLASNTMEDMKNQRDVLKVRLEAAQAGKKATMSLKAFFGNSSESDMALLAFDEIELQTNEAEAAIEQFMRVMDPALKDQDLKQQAQAIEAMERFNNFTTKKTLLPPANEMSLDAEILAVTGQKVGKQVQPGR